MTRTYVNIGTPRIGLLIHIQLRSLGYKIEGT